jgi:hypothetical protein
LRSAYPPQPALACPFDANFGPFDAHFRRFEAKLGPFETRTVPFRARFCQLYPVRSQLCAGFACTEFRKPLENNNILWKPG